MYGHSCPHCGSRHVRGSGGDVAGGDEYQDRGCLTCGRGTYWLRSAGNVDGEWDIAREVVYRPAHRSVADGQPPTHEADLLAQIRRNLDDDAARQVYADYLLEHADPLGEFIAAGLRRSHLRIAKPSREEIALLTEHWTSWLGAAARVVPPYAIELERGFFTRCDVLCGWSLGELSERERAAALASPAWSTVTHLNVPEYATRHLPTLVAGPIRRSLLVLQLEKPDSLHVLAKLDAPLAIEELHYRASYGDTTWPGTDDDTIATTLAGLRLPNLRRLYVYRQSAGLSSTRTAGALAITIVNDSFHDNRARWKESHGAVGVKRR